MRCPGFRSVVCGLMIAVGMLCGCHRTGAQRPSYKNGPVRPSDTAVVRLVETNRHMAEEADRALAHFAEEGYVMAESGYMVKSYAPVRGDSLREGETVTLFMQVRGIDSVLYRDVERQLTIGRIDEIQAVAEYIPGMQRGDSAEMIVPWYVGYGSLGNDIVPPYTNLIVKIKIN